MTDKNEAKSISNLETLGIFLFFFIAGTFITAGWYQRHDARTQVTEQQAECR